jgi:hypothetical protein
MHAHSPRSADYAISLVIQLSSGGKPPPAATHKWLQAPLAAAKIGIAPSHAQTHGVAPPKSASIGSKFGTISNASVLEYRPFQNEIIHVVFSAFECIPTIHWG